jgi:hypothetical protein
MVSEFCGLRSILAVEEQQTQLISAAQEMCCQFLPQQLELSWGATLVSRCIFQYLNARDTLHKPSVQVVYVQLHHSPNPNSTAHDSMRQEAIRGGVMILAKFTEANMRIAASFHLPLAALNSAERSN